VLQRPGHQPRSAIQRPRTLWARSSNEFTIFISFVVDSRKAQGPVSPGLVRSFPRWLGSGVHEAAVDAVGWRGALHHPRQYCCGDYHHAVDQLDLAVRHYVYFSRGCQRSPIRENSRSRSQRGSTGLKFLWIQLFGRPAAKSGQPCLANRPSSDFFDTTFYGNLCYLILRAHPMHVPWLTIGFVEPPRFRACGHELQAAMAVLVLGSHTKRQRPLTGLPCC